MQPYHKHNAAAQCADACRRPTRHSCLAVPGFHLLTDTATTEWGADWDRYLTNDPLYMDRPASACVSGSPPSLALDGTCGSLWRHLSERLSSRPRMQHDRVKLDHNNHRPRRQHQLIVHARHVFPDAVDGRSYVPCSSETTTTCLIVPQKQPRCCLQHLCLAG